MRIQVLALAAATMVAAVPQPAVAERTAAEWFDEVQKTASEQLDGIDHFVKKIRGGVMQGLMQEQGAVCNENCAAILVTPFTLENGGGMMKARYRPSPMELAALVGTTATPTTMAYFGAGLYEAQDVLSGVTEQASGPGADLARGIFGDISMNSKDVKHDIKQKTEDGKVKYESHDSEKPWLNPFRLFGAGGLMFEEATKAAVNAQTTLENRGNKVKAEALQARTLAAQGTVAGDETFDGKSAVRVNLPTPPGGDPSFNPQNASLLIDKEKFVILQHRIEGIAIVDGEPQEVFIETVNSDFRDVPGSKLYEPYKRVMRMGGMLTDEQMAQMEEARKQLEEFDKQMAEMPASQRQMMENMLGSQMDMVRQMANGGGIFEYTEIVEEILINPDLVALFNPDYGSSSGILEQIQELLIVLDYSPGNTDGVLDDLTMVAISQFQAEYGLEVTGQPGTALLNKLMAEVGK